MNDREIALKILMDIEKNKSYSNLSINKFLKREEESNGNFVREIVYGVLENTGYLDHIIGKKSKIKLRKIHKKILMILRIGSYQICFLENIPDSAAVNESVKLVKASGLNRSVGFVNAILRNIARDKKGVMDLTGLDRNEYISIKYSHPLWMVDRWIEEFGLDFAEDLCKANNSTPKLNIRTNILKIGREELIEDLESQGLSLEKTEISPYGLIVNNPMKIVDMDEYRQGMFSIQDESSMLVGEVLSPKMDSFILDICSAPGGKAFHLAEMMNNSGRILSRDIYEHKIKLIEKNRDRLGIKNIKAEVHDGLKLDESLIEQVDYCLLDAPCSALGTIRRSPEIKLYRKEKDLKDIVRLQKKLLDIGKNYLKVGGILVYSTCTINYDENLGQIEKFLKENKNFKLAEIRSERLEEFESAKKGYIEIYPNIHKMDGFFIARLERVKK